MPVFRQAEMLSGYERDCTLHRCKRRFADHMATKAKGRILPDIEVEALTGSFEEQLPSGQVRNAIVEESALPSLLSPRGQAAAVERCVWRRVTLSDPNARRLRVRDSLIQNCDLGNMDLTGGLWERVEITATR